MPAYRIKKGATQIWRIDKDAYEINVNLDAIFHVYHISDLRRESPQPYGLPVRPLGPLAV